MKISGARAVSLQGFRLSSTDIPSTHATIALAKWPNR
jgi:hypothetical protein